MIYIYSNIVTSRIRYSCEVIFKYILNIDFQFVDKEHFLTFNNSPKINYSQEYIPESIWIKPHSLLFETDIRFQEIAVSFLAGVPYFFKTMDTKFEGSQIPYDIFASTFYLVSRYEEYLPFTPDNHGRFSAMKSLAYKSHFLHLPVVHFWSDVLKNRISKFQTDHFPPLSRYKHLNTIDIDIAYAYRGKPFLRQLGGCIKSVLRFDVTDIKLRFEYLIRGKDPYDTYSYIENIIKKTSSESILFFQLGDHGKYDKNIPLKRTLKKLIERLSKSGEIGIHPSYRSNEKTSVLTKEIKRLKQVSRQEIVKSRQHFLKLRFPETYENLIVNGITADYTLGYTDQLGFRAGICVAYPFFNIVRNEQRPLLLVPFQVMDGVLKDYLMLSPEESMEKINTIKNSIREVNGIFVSIFHNSSLTEVGEWKQWRRVYEETF